MQAFASFLAQLKSPLIIILLAASIVSIFLGRVTDGVVILAVVIANSIFGTFWEVKAAREIKSLEKYIAPKAKIIINGRETEIPIEELKLGDSVLIEAGDRIPADGILTQATFLKIDESALTGESIPVEKGERAKVFAGTLALVGSGIFKVRAVGGQTEIGKLAKTVALSPEVATPLQKRIATLGKFLAIILVLISFATFIAGLLANYNLALMFTTAVALAVASVPEGLPIAVTVVLAVGVIKMAGKKAIVAKLASVEALGSVTIIATDKTGTLTKGQIQAAKVYLADDKILEDIELLRISPTLKKLLTAGIVCNNARIRIGDDSKIIGDPAEAALLKLAEKFGLDWRGLRTDFPKIAEFPFDPKFRYMATLNQIQNPSEFSGKQIIFVKGAPTDVVRLCDSKLDGEEVTRIAEKMARQGLRVLALAYHQIEKEWLGIEKEKISGRLSLLGLVGFADQIREEAYQTVEKLKAAGVKVLMVTGDHELTAAQIANQAGLSDHRKAISWLSKPEEEILAQLPEFNVLARVPPTAKMAIVKKLQNNGEIVAMTGDGVNDGPALVAADVGVALGGAGTDVAREAADIVLTDDNLSTIHAALVEGRVIFQNIRKIVVYLLSDSFGAIILTAGSIFAGLPLPLLPAQILWINLVTDSLPDISLAFEPVEASVLKSLPSKNSQILSAELKFLVFLIATASGLLALFLFTISLAFTGNLDYARTLTFATLGANTLVYIFSVRSLQQNLWQINFFSNKFLLASVSASFLILALGIYFQPLAVFFGTVALNLNDWLIVGTICLLVVLVIEFVKFIFNLGQK